MKPLKLEMQAFESYYDKTVIDFEKLNDQKVFLILGKTGCGKTTIFDALSYALYDESSGAQRSKEKNGLKNRDADYTKECYVELTFEDKGKKYRIRRAPTQDVVATRKKEGYKNVQATVKLDFLDEPDKPSMTSKVNEKIVEILGLDKNQFNQVCMLAQGDFSKILTSDTQERTRILRKIFQTELYNDFSRKVSEKYNSVSNEMKTIRDNLNDTYERTVYLTDAENEKKNEETSDDYRISFMKNGIVNCDDALSSNQKEKDASNQKIISLNAELKDAKDHQKDLENEQLEKENILKYKNKDESLKEKMKGLEEKKPEIDDAHNKATALTFKLPTYQRLTELNKETKEAKEKLDQKKIEETKNQQNLTNFKTKSMEYETRLGEIEEELKSETDSGVELSKLNVKSDDLTSAINVFKELRKTKEQLKSCLTEFETKQKRFSEINHRHDAIELGYYSSMAGNLAHSQLKDNMPCPVCGSLSHPHPASLSSDDVSKEDYEESKKDVEKARDEKENARNKLESLSSKNDQITKNLNEALVSLSLSVDVNSDRHDYLDQVQDCLKESVEKNNQEIHELESRQKHYQKLHEDKDFYEREKKNIALEIEKTNSLLTSLTSEISSLETKADEIDKQYQALKGTLEFDEEKEARDEIDRLKNIESQYEEKKALLEEEIKENTNLLSISKGRLESVQKRIENYKGREEDAIILELNEEKANYETLGNEEKKIVSIKSGISNSLSSYTKKKADNEKLSKKFNLLAKFNRYFNASIAKKFEGGEDTKRWVSLETYILGYYLDRILERASLRLERMSDGNYSLLRRTDDDIKGSKQGGLDIDVRDNVSMTVRHAATLSGGETFMASLSLALGLSDYVKESTSKSKIETLYVDEGFGTLDKETLERVVDVLTELASKESTSIGLISHVEDLKSYFPKGIQVVKDVIGHSSLKII